MDIKVLLEQYDESNLKHKKILDKVNNYRFEFIEVSENDKRDKIQFFDKNKNKIVEYEYEVIGSLNIKSKIFRWSWAISSLPKKNTKIMREIWNYCTSVNNDEIINIDKIKQEFIESRLYISHSYILDIHLAYCMYISKIPLICSLKIKDTDRIDFFYLFD
jgi:hypothetical protein